MAANVHVDPPGLEMYMRTPRGYKCTCLPPGAANRHVDPGAANVHEDRPGLQMYMWTPGAANVHVVPPGLQMYMWTTWAHSHQGSAQGCTQSIPDQFPFSTSNC